tara:strand:- start:5703 stop:5999 length:297 start_codon:yes stop_codon:yes gene_type:complete
MGDARAAHFLGADTQRIDSPLHRIVGQATAEADALSKSDDPRKTVNDTEPLALLPGDQQPAVVRTKIQGAKYFRLVAPAILKPASMFSALTLCCSPGL